MRFPVWLLRIIEQTLPARSLRVLHGEALPQTLPLRGLVLLRDEEEDWCIGMRCPCGCGQRVELPLIPEVRPCWKLRLESDGRPTLIPSVWLREGCRSHFFIRKGKVEWI
jgi:hypothetical protein